MNAHIVTFTTLEQCQNSRWLRWHRVSAVHCPGQHSAKLWLSAVQDCTQFYSTFTQRCLVGMESRKNVNLLHGIEIYTRNAVKALKSHGTFNKAKEKGQRYSIAISLVIANYLNWFPFAFFCLLSYLNRVLYSYQLVIFLNTYLLFLSTCNLPQHNSFIPISL